VRVLFDTHFLIWSADGGDSIPKAALPLLLDPANTPCFSVAAIWEIAIKTALGKPGFRFDPANLRRDLLDAGWGEITIEARHAIAAAVLPRLHDDPFDRLMVGQALVEEIQFVTADRKLGGYPGNIVNV
jgi:PIN domain nuclease of toxin-antitoxin system